LNKKKKNHPPPYDERRLVTHKELQEHEGTKEKRTVIGNIVVKKISN